MSEISNPVSEDDFISFIELLNENSVDYILVGGQCLLTHGFTRFTEDIDILCKDAGLIGAKRLLKVISKVPDSGVSELDDPLILAHDKNEEHDVIRVNAQYTIDIMYSCSGFTYEDIIDDIIMVKNDESGFYVPCAGLSTLREMKRNSSRPKDISDCASIDLFLSMDTCNAPSI